MSAISRPIINAIDNADFDDNDIATITIAMLEIAAKRGVTAWEAIAKKIEDSNDSAEIGESLRAVVMTYLYYDEDEEETASE